MVVAPMTMSPLVRSLITAYDWRAAMLIVGIIAWVLLIPAASLIRNAPAAAPRSGAAPVPESSRAAVVQALRSPQFIVLGFTFFACCAAHSGPIFHMVSYAMHCGLAPMVAVSVYSVEGLAGLGGRILFGVAADRLGAKRVLIAGLLIQAGAIATYLLVRELGEFYALATLFGMTYGGVMPLYAVLAREYFGQHIMGTVFGAAAMLSSIGMSIGPLAGGWVFDTFGDYAWMFVASSAVGIGAAALAFAFPPVRRPSPLAEAVI
jgi:MFS family permease